VEYHRKLMGVEEPAKWVRGRQYIKKSLLSKAGKRDYKFDVNLVADALDSMTILVSFPKFSKYMIMRFGLFGRLTLVNDLSFLIMMIVIRSILGVTTVAMAIGWAIGSHLTVKASPKFVTVAFGCILWFFSVEIAFHLLGVL